MEELPTELSNEKKLELIKWAISSEQGWKSLAGSIKGFSDPDTAKAKCLEHFATLAVDKTIKLSIKICDCKSDCYCFDDEIEIKYYDFLVQQLEQHINSLE